MEYNRKSMPQLFVLNNLLLNNLGIYVRAELDCVKDPILIHSVVVVKFYSGEPGSQSNLILAIFRRRLRLNTSC
ncbi:Hypothetical predicted protein [Podarcis lilfordi]|uniref:Uncharacterized protein n=1 Tax=Podarcis lilfordi TaxID=74358 RepID=A0AA35JZZ5_9SAUR|nr:Hypothetical predicted protein [Podarcis lilfordi]